MKKYILMICMSLAFCFVGVGLIKTFSSFKTPLDGDKNNTLYWLPEESFFVDYEITDKNTVKFRYSICFVNSSDNNTTISLSAKFNKKELNGWLEQESFFDGYDETGKLLYKEIPRNKKVNVTFVFEGEFLGGEVNQNLSFPEEIILMTS